MAEEIHNARLHMFLNDQSRPFDRGIKVLIQHIPRNSPIFKLIAHLDPHHIFRMGGRLQNEKHSIITSKNI